MLIAFCFFRERKAVYNTCFKFQHKFMLLLRKIFSLAKALMPKIWNNEVGWNYRNPIKKNGRKIQRRKSKLHDSSTVVRDIRKVFRYFIDIIQTKMFHLGFMLCHGKKLSFDHEINFISLMGSTGYYYCGTGHAKRGIFKLKLTLKYLQI